MKESIVRALRWSERYTKTDMVYLVKNSFWLNLNTIISSIFSLLLSIAFARYVSKEVFGNYQFLVSLAAMVGTLTLTGMNSSVNQAVARGLDGVLKDSVKVQFKYSLIPLLFGLLLSAYYFISGALTFSLSLVVIAILLPVINALNTWTAYVSGKKDFLGFFSQSQLINLLNYGAMAVCIFWSPQTFALVATNFLTLAFGNWITYQHILKKVKPHEPTEPEAIEFGKKLSLSNILPMVALQIDNLLIFHLLGAASLAIYVFASNVPEKIISLLRPISSVAFPKMASADHNKIRQELGHKIKLFLFLVAFFVLLYFLIAPAIYSLLFPEYLDSIRYSQVYIVAAALSTVASFSASFMFASRSKKIFSFNIINPTVNIIAMVVGALSFGVWGVIGAKIIGSGFSLVYSYLLGEGDSA